MKFVAAILILCLLCLCKAQMPCPEECGPDECCAGGGYHRYCRKLAENGEQCESPNSMNWHSTACPCKEGMVCSVINRCQYPY